VQADGPKIAGSDFVTTTGLNTGMRFS
jgi:hypothetical protein